MCISPLPATLKLSVDSPSVTLNETSFKSSLIKRSRSWREVTNLPSLPANGLSFTENVISIVGSLIFTNGRGAGSSGEAIVSPIVISGIPEKHIISPTFASSTAVLLRPSI